MREYCKHDNIELTFQPSYSPEFNSIESLWAIIKHRVKQRLVEMSDVWIDQARFVEMLNQTLNSVTPEEARKAAANNRGDLNFMLLQMQRLQLTDNHLDTLQEVAIDDEQSVDSHPDDNEGLQSQDSLSLLDVVPSLLSTMHEAAKLLSTHRCQVRPFIHDPMSSTWCEIILVRELTVVTDPMFDLILNSKSNPYFASC